MKKVLTNILLLVILIQISCASRVDSTQSNTLTPIVLQLRWDHQFQFAGYYAAAWQGYYEEAGLDVEIRSAMQPDRTILSATTEVAEGRADFGIGAADILIARDEGADLRVVSTIFQESAARFYLKEETPYQSIADLTNLRVARRVNDLIDVELQSILLSEGLDIDKVPPYPHEPGIDHLLSDEVQVMPGYATSMPYLFNSQEGQNFKEINPVTYGINFYGDSIFTTGTLISEDPDLVEAFVRASNKGWVYALDHSQEIATKITDQLDRSNIVDDELAFNLFQAEVVGNLMLYPITEVGHTNPLRWQRMNQFLQDLGLVQTELDPNTFTFDPQIVAVERSERLRTITTGGLGVLIGILVLSIGWGYSLRRLVDKRTGELERELLIRQQVEQDLLHSEEDLRVTLHSIGDAVIATDLQGNITRINKVAIRLTGWTLTEAKGKPLTQVFNIVNAHSLQPAFNPVQTVLEKGEIVELANHTMLLSKNGDKYHIADSAAPIKDKDEKVVGVVLVFRDVTTEYRILEELRESEQRFSSAFNFAAIGKALVSPEGDIIKVNSAFCSILGYSEEDLLAKTFQDITHPDDLELDLVYVQQMLKGEIETYQMEKRYLHKSGKIIWVLLSVSLVYQEGGRPRYFISQVVDITKRKETQNALSESERNLRITLNSIGDAVISTDINGSIIRMNPVAQKLTGWTLEESEGKPLKDVFSIVQVETHQAIENLVEEILQTDQVITSTHYTLLISRDGTEYYITNSGAPIRDDFGNIVGLVLVFRDETEKLKIEEELLKSRKLESVGVLAGGIAHDFNNLLTSLFANMELARMYLPATHQAYSYLEMAGQAMDDAVNLTKQLLTFARGGKPVKKVIELGKLIAETAQFAVRGSRSKLQLEIEPNLWLVEADKGQINQVITNLIINAQQAMPSGGLIVATCENEQTENGDFVKIMVVDEGGGIAPQHLDKIFDPYFSTKKSGSGLGLATTYSIVNKHRGRIEVESKLNEGTKFTIFLPAIRRSPSFNLITQPKKENNMKVNKFSRILVLDDEDSVRKALVAALTHLGYQVSAVSDGQEAVQCYKEAMDCGDSYAAGILDLTIPGELGGQEVAQEILRLHSHARLVVSSGYANDPIMANYTSYGFKGRIEKPYRLQELAEELQQVLLA